MKIYNEKTSQFEEVKSVKYYSEEEGSIIKSVEEYQIPFVYSNLEFSEELWHEGDYLPESYNCRSSNFSVLNSSCKFTSNLLKTDDNLIITVDMLEAGSAYVYIDDIQHTYLTSSGQIVLNYKEYMNHSIGFAGAGDLDVLSGPIFTFSIETSGSGFIPIKSIKQYQDANNSITLENFNQ